MSSNVLKKSGICLFLFAIIILLGSVPGLALTPQQKIQYVTAAIQGAKDSIKKGEVGEARMAMLAVLNEIQTLAPSSGQSPVKELFADYMVARNMAWSSAPAQMTVEAFKAFLMNFNKQRAELLKLSYDLNMDNLPNGKNQYYKKIADVLGQRKSAYKKVGEFAMTAPPPDHLLASREMYMVMFQQQIPRMFFNVTFGPALAAGHAQQRVIPENLKMAEEALKEAQASKDPSVIWLKINDSDKSIDLCEKIEAAVRGEIDLSKQVAGISAMRKIIESETKRAEVLFDKQVDSNRMPDRMAWSAGNESALIQEIKGVYKENFPKDKVLKVVLRSKDFGERWETTWDKDAVYTAYFGYVKAAVAVKQTEDVFRVFFKWFRKELKADGKWTPLYYHKTTGSYRIREKNI